MTTFAVTPHFTHPKQPLIVTFNVGSATIKMAAYDSATLSNAQPLDWQALFDVNINLKTHNKV